jgi:hypothetical protein
MYPRYFFAFVVLATLGLLAGCGGGGSSIGGVASTPPSTGTTISGVASKGIIRGGTVNIFALPASGDLGGKILLKSVTTDSAGGYSANVGNYAGVVLIEVSGDNVYTDEATGSRASISSAAPLRAAVVVSGSGGTTAVAVTPLTELATRRAISGTTLTPAAVSSANALVSNLFQLDIIATQPVEPGVTAINAASQAQRDYTVALAGISQLAAGAGSLTAVVDTLYHDLATTDRISAATAASFQSAVTAFLADGTHNQTGITQKSPALAAAGKYTGVLYLATQGSASAPITSLQLTLTLPAGVVIKKDSLGAPLVSVSGVASRAAAPAVNYNSTDTMVLAIISSPGFGLGQFATVSYFADPGAIPVAGDFKITSSRVTGFDGANDFDIAVNVVPLLP